MRFWISYPSASPASKRRADSAPFLRCELTSVNDERLDELEEFRRITEGRLNVLEADLASLTAAFNAFRDLASSRLTTLESGLSNLAFDLDGDVSGVLAALSGHTSQTTNAHGGIVSSSDHRLSDARTPLPHSHPG